MVVSTRDCHDRDTLIVLTCPLIRDNYFSVFVPVRNRDGTKTEKVGLYQLVTVMVQELKNNSQNNSQNKFQKTFSTIGKLY